MKLHKQDCTHVAQLCCISAYLRLHSALLVPQSLSGQDWAQNCRHFLEQVTQVGGQPVAKASTAASTEHPSFRNLDLDPEVTVKADFFTTVVPTGTSSTEYPTM